MTYRSRWALGLGCAAAFAGGCSSTSGTPYTPTPTPTATAPVPDAAPETCDAVSLAAAADASAAACFDCVASHCMPELTSCSTDCACAPNYGCLEQMSMAGSLNTGYSQCQNAVDAIMNGDKALTMLNNCASMSCNAPCFGGAGDSGGSGDGGDGRDGGGG